MLTTKATVDLPKIEWELIELLERDSEERMEVFNVVGTDSKGNEYSGSAYFFCDIFEEIKDIEKL